MSVSRLALAAVLASLVSPWPASPARAAGVPGPAGTQVAALGGPRILEVGTADEDDDEKPLRETQREQLLREFPDNLVEGLWLQDWSDVERAYQMGRLVDVVSDPAGRGIVLRTSGSSRIGELEDDHYHRQLLCRLSRPAAGLLYRIASRLRHIEGDAFVPLEVTSLVRTWDYQLRLAYVNPNADRTREGVPPTHVLGMAFDIARTQMSAERQRRLENLLDQMAMSGDLSYYKEGSRNGLKHYHVMALPSAEVALAREYERSTWGDASWGMASGGGWGEAWGGGTWSRGQAAEAPAGARARSRNGGDAPCVEFGSSLEPFSAICSCELPLEVSAHAWIDQAPISR